MQQNSRRRGRPKSFHGKQSQNTIQSLDRALDVLELLASSAGLTLTEISEALDQSPATMYRALSTLEGRNMVEVDQMQQTWHIGPTAFRVGSSFLQRSGVIERSRPVMRQLVEQTGETANLGIEKSDMVLFVSQVETRESIRAFFPPGTLSQMHASGIGKALLSCYSEERLANLLSKMALEGFTEHTITDAEGLRAEMEKIRQQGYAFDNEEKTLGMRCIAAPILNFYGEAVAGISVSGPTNRMTLERVDAIGAVVKAAAENLSRSLGAAAE